MTLRRFPVSAPLVAGARVALPDHVQKHVRVLRLDEGARVELFDGRGHEADAVLDGTSARVERVREVPVEPRIVVVAGMPKASVLDEILRSATETGASEIRLALAERSVVKRDDARIAHKQERWDRIVEEAARQSERAHAPQVRAPEPLDRCLADVPPDALVTALDARSGDDVDALLASRGASASEIWLVFGPEGGLSSEELAGLRQRGAVLAKAALPVLRVETAVPVLTALARLALRREATSGVELR